MLAKLDAGVVAALVAAGASVLVSVTTAFISGRREGRIRVLEHALRQEDVAAEREAEANTILARYREPLLSAAFDLQSRLHNILYQSFLEAYVASDNSRREQAILSTLYRIAQYFAWTEILRQDVQFLDFQELSETRTVADKLSRVSRTFASDHFGHGMMIWVDEQRGIGELLIERSGSTTSCIGYASFVGRWDSTMSSWLHLTKTALVSLPSREPVANGTRQRLEKLEDQLQQLVDVLDEKIRYPHPWRERAPAPPRGE